MAYVRANIFYEREQWKKPVLLSVGFHGVLVLAIIVWGFAMQSHSTANDWGIKQGDAVTAQLVSASIPIPKTEQSDNIVANENKGDADATGSQAGGEASGRRNSDPGKS